MRAPRTPESEERGEEEDKMRMKRRRVEDRRSASGGGLGGGHAGRVPAVPVCVCGLRRNTIKDVPSDALDMERSPFLGLSFAQMHEKRQGKTNGRT